MEWCRRSVHYDTVTCAQVRGRVYLLCRHGTRGWFEGLRVLGSVLQGLNGTPTWQSGMGGCDAAILFMVRHISPGRGDAVIWRVTHRCCLTHSFIAKHMRLTTCCQEAPHIYPSVGGVPLMRVCGRLGPRLQGKLAIAGVVGKDGDPCTAWSGAAMRRPFTRLIKAVLKATLDERVVDT